jgi:ABC-2 type transport system permease protein
MNRQLWACAGKEALLLWRDWHGLLLLFAMPLVFILVMSLAMQEQFAARAGKRLAVVAVDRDDSAASRELLARLAASGAFALQQPQPLPTTAQVQAQLRAGGYAFALEIGKGYGDRLRQPPATAAPPLVAVTVAADSGRQTELIFLAALREALGRQRVDLLLAEIGAELPGAEATGTELAVGYAYREGDGQAPSAVQQNVPAWLVFAVFFVVIPLSNTLIRERELGMLRRLRSVGVSGFTLLASKWLTFFAVNLLQVLSMLLAGRYLVPLVGGEALLLNGSPPALVLLAVALSAAALGYALLIAVVAKTTEQATMLGGAGNIILAAIGGIMVPTFVMPAALQTVAGLSPMNWGLQGFLDVLLRGGGIAEVWPEAAALLAFGAATLALAALLQRRQVE